VLSDEDKKKFYEIIGYEGEDTSTLTYPKKVIINLFLMCLYHIHEIVCRYRSYNSIDYAWFKYLVKT